MCSDRLWALPGLGYASAVSHTCASGVHVHSQEEPVTPLPCSFALTATYHVPGPCIQAISAMVVILGTPASTLFSSVLHPIWVNCRPY